MADEASSIMKTLVFIVVFSALFSFLFAYTYPMFHAGADSPSEDSWISDTFDPAEIAQMTFWLNDDGNESGYAPTDLEQYNTQFNIYYGVLGWVEPAHTGYAPPGYAFSFYDNSDHDNEVIIYPMRDITLRQGFENTFVCWQGWGWWDQEYELVHFADIVASVNDDNIAKMTIDLKGKMNVYFVFEEGMDPSYALANADGYRIVVGQSFLDSTESSQNIWNAMSALLTFNLDTGNNILNYLVSLPIWVAIAFIGFWVVTRILGAIVP